MTKSSARREQLTSRPAERQRFTKGPTMNDLTDEQRARALELYRLYPPVRVAPDHQETGTAHSRDDLMRWTCETTAPVVAPKPDPRIQVVVEWPREPASSTREDAAEARRKARAGRKLERRWARVSAGIEVAMWEADLSYSAATRVAEAMDRLYYPEAWK